MKPLELINETVEYYKTHPRGISKEEGYCVYKSSTGDKCAVGRCIQDKFLDNDQLHQWVFVGGVEALEENLKKEHLTFEEVLKPEYRGQLKSVWKSLQNWHDRKEFWHGGNDIHNEPQKMTLQGQDFLKRMLSYHEREE